MNIIDNIEKYFDSNNIKYTKEGDRKYKINDELFYVSIYKKIIIKANLCLNLFPTELPIAESCDYTIFEFGGDIYYTPTKNDVTEEVKWNKMSVFEFLPETSLPLLGLHTAYEYGNAVNMPSDLLKSAKKRGYTQIGVADLNNMGSFIEVEEKAQKNNQDFVLGASYQFKEGLVTIYCMNEWGYRQCLKINKVFMIDHIEDYSLIDALKENRNLDQCKVVLHLPFDFSQIPLNDNLYCNIYLPKLRDKQSDEKLLEGFKTWSKSKNVKPVFIPQVYYCNQDQEKAKRFLNRSSDRALNPYLEKGFNEGIKPPKQYFSEFLYNFENKDSAKAGLMNAIKNTITIVKDNEYRVSRVNKLPQYIMSPEEKAKYGSRKNLFMALIKENWASKITYDLDQVVYMDRLKMELSLIIPGGFVNYFLINSQDIQGYTKKKGGIVSRGRGSAAGSLVAYLLGITGLDPIKEGLIFERFLNKGRVIKEVEQDFIYINDDIKLKPYSLCEIRRNSKIIQVTARNLKESDDLLSWM